MAPAANSKLKPASASRNNSNPTEERLTRNPYFNFLKEFRRENSNLNPNEVIRQGAEQWKQLSDAQRRPFVLEAQNQPPIERVRRMVSRARSPRRRQSQARVGRSRSRSVSRSRSRSGSRMRRGGRKH